MLLLKITKKSLFSRNKIIFNHIKYLSHNIEILEFVQSETFSYYLRWVLLFVCINLHNV